MKSLKKSAIIVATGIIFTLLLTTKSMAATGKINAETVNLRKEASTSSKILEQLDKGEKVEILEDTGDWYKVKYNSITGYISKRLLETEGTVETNNNPVNETKPTEQEQPEGNNENQAGNTETEVKKKIEINSNYTITSEIEVKIIPLMNAIKSTKLQANTQVKVLDNMNNWYYVETENNSGWIRKQLLESVINLNNENVTPTVTTTPEETTPVTTTPVETENNGQQTKYTEYETPKTGYISGGSVNFRKESNTSSEVIKKLTRNTELQILGETTNNWYKITVDGQTGYVSSQYVSDTKVADQTSRGMSSTQINNMPEVTNNNETNNTTVEENQQQEETPQEPTETKPTSNIGDEIVAYAKTFLGTKYVSGGSSPSAGFDCSGFTKYIYAHFGITLNRVSSDQVKNGVAVNKSELVPGDLLIFNGSSNKSIGHVGIYIGNNQFIHASNPSDGVKITSMSDSYYVKRYVGARRVF